MIQELKVFVLQIVLSLVVAGLWYAVWKSAKLDDTTLLIMMISTLYVSLMFWIIKTRSVR
jgi:hypothetical protein